MPFPYEVYNFNFSFWLKIIDWYNSTHSYWKCVFFKSPNQHLNENNKIIKTSKWEEIVDELPDQCIGVWLAPFTNNLRICITTERETTKTISLPQPNKQICTSTSCLYTNDLHTKQIDGENYKEHIELMNKYLDENKKEGEENTKPKTQDYTVIKSVMVNVGEETKKEILMEHFDILNIPIGESLFMSVNIIKLLWKFILIIN